MTWLYQAAAISKQAVHHKKQGSVRLDDTAERKAAFIAAAYELRDEHPGCGVEKIYDTLSPDWIGRDKACHLLMQAGLRLRRKAPFRRTTFSVRSHYENLIEGMLLSGKNQLWQTDITYFELGGRWYYLVFIVDVYTRVIVGYCASDHMRAEANIEALNMALKSQGAAGLKGLIHHSDRGSQYHDQDYLKLLSGAGMWVSMALSGPDNAYAERVNGTIKNEYLEGMHLESFAQLKRALKASVAHYNQKRIHRSLPGKTTPGHFEQELLHLSTQKRPKVIVYTDGNPNLKAASSRLEVYPEKDLQAPVCPMVYS